jgi:arylsulfatase A-like enzyme
MYHRSPIPPARVPEWVRREPRPHWLGRQHATYSDPPMGADELRDARAVYYGKVTNLDHQLGRLLATLMARDLWDDTLLVYTSDHGEMLGDFDLLAKSNFLDAAANVPLIVRPPHDWAGRRGQRCDALCCGEDLLLTFCRAAGADPPPDAPGCDLLQLLDADTRPGDEPLLHGNLRTQHMIRDDQHKFIYDSADDAWVWFRPGTDPPPGPDEDGGTHRFETHHEVSEGPVTCLGQVEIGDGAFALHTNSREG